MVAFWTAAGLCAAFVIVGALTQGAAGMQTYSELSDTTRTTAFLLCLMAAATVALMTWWGMPVSTSQAVVGALIAVGVFNGRVALGVLGKVVICWVGTPIGAALMAVVLYFAIGKLVNLLRLTIFQYDFVLRWCLVLAGCYGSYALGANNVANTTGAFVGDDMLSVQAACLVGGLSIALGVLTYSRDVMMTVGQGLVKLDALSALVVVAAEALTVHVYAFVGVPVSTSQAVVGGVLGIGFVKGVRTINAATMRNILLAWLATPVLSFAATLGACYAGRSLGWL
jgi:PiT family inorganic phosphate transporter